MSYRSRIPIAGLVVGLAAVASLLVAPLASADQIAYSCGYDICVIDPDNPESNTNLTKTSGEDSGEYAPSWSPDGHWLAYNADYNGLYETFVIDATKTAEENEAINVTETVGFNGARDNAPAWSPDGSRVAFSADYFYIAGQADTESDVFVGAFDGSSTAVPIGRTTASERYPSWTPDGRLLFSRNAAGLIGPATSSGPFTPVAGAFGDEMVISPDGKYIAAGTLSSYPYKISIAKADGSGAVLLDKHSTLFAGNVSWSPDSTRVTYVNDEQPSGGSGANDQVWVAPADKSSEGNAVPLPAGWVGPHNPRFSPDGTRVAFSASPLSGSPPYPQVLVGPADGSAPAVPITKSAASNEQPFWKPCEGCAPPPKPPTNPTPETEKKTPQKIRLASIKRVVHYPRLLVSVDCSAEGGHPDPKYCNGDGIAKAVTYTGLNPRPWAKPKLKKKTIVFAKGSVKVPGGQSKPLKLKVTAAGKKLAKPGKTLKVQVVVKVSRDQEKAETFKQTVKVKVPKKK